jgi:hypothetical protein
MQDKQVPTDTHQVHVLQVPVSACVSCYGESAGHVNGLQRRQLLDTRTARVRWEPQEEGVMRTAASFPSVRNQGLSNQ